MHKVTALDFFSCFPSRLLLIYDTLVSSYFSSLTFTRAFLTSYRFPEGRATIKKRKIHFSMIKERSYTVYDYFSFLDFNELSFHVLKRKTLKLISVMLHSLISWSWRTASKYSWAPWRCFISITLTAFNRIIRLFFTLLSTFRDHPFDYAWRFFKNDW